MFQIKWLIFCSVVSRKKKRFLRLYIKTYLFTRVIFPVFKFLLHTLHYNSHCFFWSNKGDFFSQVFLVLPPGVRIISNFLLKLLKKRRFWVLFLIFRTFFECDFFLNQFHTSFFKDFVFLYFLCKIFFYGCMYVFF